MQEVASKISFIHAELKPNFAKLLKQEILPVCGNSLQMKIAKKMFANMLIEIGRTKTKIKQIQSNADHCNFFLYS